MSVAMAPSASLLQQNIETTSINTIRTLFLWTACSRPRPRGAEKASATRKGLQRSREIDLRDTLVDSENNAARLRWLHERMAEFKGYMS